MSISNLKDIAINSATLHTLNAAELYINGESVSTASMDVMATPTDGVLGNLPPILINLRRIGNQCMIQVPAMASIVPIAGVGAYNIWLPPGTFASLGMQTSGNRQCQSLSLIDGAAYVPTRISVDTTADLIMPINASAIAGTFVIATSYACHPFQLCYINDT